MVNLCILLLPELIAAVTTPLQGYGSALFCAANLLALMPHGVENTRTTWPEGLPKTKTAAPKDRRELI
jgi:hypothetical protein